MKIKKMVTTPKAGEDAEPLKLWCDSEGLSGTAASEWAASFWQNYANCVSQRPAHSYESKKNDHVTTERPGRGQ